MKEIGYLKYKGDLVKSGLIDAKTAGNALVGLDEAIRYFNEKQSPEFSALDYQIPVKIEEGSWIAMVMATLGAGVGAFALGYLKKAGEKMAENDFKDIGLGDVFKKSIDAFQSLLRLSKHTKKDRDWDLTKVHITNDRKLIGIPNEQGEIIYIPYDYMNWFKNFPHSIIPKMTDSINDERELIIGLKNDDEPEEVVITKQDKHIFSKVEEEIYDDILFPEFKHGDNIRLEGKLRRGNESSNSLGFEYKGHMINCIPESGTVVKFKEALFEKCVIVGTISRYSKNHKIFDKRPTIIISHVVQLNDQSQHSLF
jgi:hypothetical protein